MDDVHLKRLVWRSRRGLLELDLQLERFVAEVLPTLDDAALAEFENVLLLPDNDFLDYLNGKADCPDERLKPMLARIRGAQQ
ncbi:FAD assembly factor SdhE [Chitinilyticum aquatile]|uniref:FAD assembly factor SdhE n=1 Tax=Chitinilyticum aquatile TaxID=362520 RepID=UPI00041753BB|nr:succinate dehydrogenase assembly factor 2 [Chitinilyticum aquatile]